MYGYGYSYPNNPQGSGLMGRYEAGVRSDGGSFAFPIDTGLASRLEGLGLLNASSLVNSCNAGKESVLYNLIPTPVQSLDRFAVTRSTVKWVLGANGLLQEIPANTPAFEYNTDGTYRGLLVEPAGTNSIRNNTQVGAVVGTPGTFPTNWTQNTAGLTRDVVAIGTENGVDYIDLRLHGTATGVSCEIRFDTAIGALTGQTWTESVYLKKVAEPLPPNSYGTYIFETTDIGGFVSGGVQTQALTSTLARFTQTRTLSGGATTARVVPNFRAGVTNGATYDFTIRIGLPQMEQSSVATSVIKTSGTSLTRTADSVTLTGASSLIGATEGTLYAEVRFSRVNTNIFLSLNDGTVDNRFQLSLVDSTTMQVLVRSATVGANYTATIPAVPSTGGVYRIAVAYKQDDYCIAVNGTAYASTASRPVPIGLNRVIIGETGFGTSIFNDCIRSVVLFPNRLANATLATLTSS